MATATASLSSARRAATAGSRRSDEASSPPQPARTRKTSVVLKTESQALGERLRQSPFANLRLRSLDRVGDSHEGGTVLVEIENQVGGARVVVPRLADRARVEQPAAARKVGLVAAGGEPTVCAAILEDHRQRDVAVPDHDDGRRGDLEGFARHGLAEDVVPDGVTGARVVQLGAVHPRRRLERLEVRAGVVRQDGLGPAGRGGCVGGELVERDRADHAEVVIADEAQIRAHGDELAACVRFGAVAHEVAETPDRVEPLVLEGLEHGLQSRGITVDVRDDPDSHGSAYPGCGGAPSRHRVGGARRLAVAHDGAGRPRAASSRCRDGFRRPSDQGGRGLPPRPPRAVGRAHGQPARCSLRAGPCRAAARASLARRKDPPRDPARARVRRAALGRLAPVRARRPLVAAEARHLASRLRRPRLRAVASLPRGSGRDGRRGRCRDGPRPRARSTVVARRRAGVRRDRRRRARAHAVRADAAPLRARRSPPHRADRAASAGGGRPQGRGAGRECKSTHDRAERRGDRRRPDDARRALGHAARRAVDRTVRRVRRGRDSARAVARDECCLASLRVGGRLDVARSDARSCGHGVPVPQVGGRSARPATGAWVGARHARDPSQSRRPGGDGTCVGGSTMRAVSEPVHAVDRLAWQLARIAGVPVELERPGKAEHGDYATNVAMRLAPERRRNPRELAEELAAQATELPAVERAEVAGPGFLNLWLADAWFAEALAEVDDDYGAGSVESRERVQVEMVSANPTGPITVASARNGAYGDSVARLLDFAGHTVEREYYYNDAGAQMDRFRISVEARRRGEEPPEDGYHGAYVDDLARSEGDPV